jgi:hypothetical protein
LDKIDLLVFELVSEIQQQTPWRSMMDFNSISDEVLDAMTDL